MTASPVSSVSQRRSGEREAPAADSRTADARRIIGWACAALSAGGASLWMGRGVAQNFEEGWYLPRLEYNVGLMLAQYVLPALVIGFLAVVAIAFPRSGAALHVLAGGWAIGQARGPGAATVIASFAIPMILLGIGYAWGRPAPRGRAVALVVLLPAATMIASTVGPALRVSRRQDDGFRGERTVVGNAVALAWAPEGPGWPREGVTWSEAVRRSRHLSEDGRSLVSETVDAWRLPTVEEAVRSVQCAGRPCGGRWDSPAGQASYDRTPDKEAPLWDVYSPVVAWWTGTEPAPGRALAISSDGSVQALRKRTYRVPLGFRAVRCAQAPTSAGTDGGTR